MDAFLEFDETFFGNLVLVPTNLAVTVDPSTADITLLDDDGMSARKIVRLVIL